MSDNLIQNWIMENKKEGISASQLVDELVFVSYPYTKYAQTVFAMKQGVWNVPLVQDLGKECHTGSLKSYKETSDFVEYLGERIALALNYFKGKTNDEIKALGVSND